MARVFIYERPLDAILTDMTFYDKLNVSNTWNIINKRKFAVYNSFGLHIHYFVFYCLGMII